MNKVGPCGRNCKKHGLHWESGCGQAGDEAAELGGVQIMLGLVIQGKEGSSQSGQEGYTMVSVNSEEGWTTAMGKG